MARLLFIVVGIFKAWMFIDAVRRQADTHWYYVILFVPGGGVAYLFQVKLKDPSVRFAKQRMFEGLKRPPTVDQLRRAHNKTPSMHNRTRLAQGLFDDGQQQAALKHFQAVLTEQADDKAALFGAGSCLVELGRYREALEPLRRMVDEHPGYRDYGAWADLTEALWQLDEHDESLELVQELARRSPRLSHIVFEARYLQRAGRSAEATRRLNEALEDHRDAPRHQQRKDRAFARQARRMLTDMA